jgi:DMSO/TMAO reductase YedYZ heme-binding membrane subunit
MNEQIWWYVARASGIVASGFLVASLVWGVLLATRARKGSDRPAWLLDLHRWLGGLAVTATALHLVALWADGYVTFGPKELFVPFASSWQPGAVAVGIVAMYLLVLVQVTSLLMKRIPRRWWRAIHLSSYAAVWLGIVHAGLAGTDTTNRVYQAGAYALTALTMAAVIARIVLGGSSARRAAGRSTADRVPSRSFTAASPVVDDTGLVAEELTA